MKSRTLQKRFLNQLVAIRCATFRRGESHQFLIQMGHILKEHTMDGLMSICYLFTTSYKSQGFLNYWGLHRHAHVASVRTIWICLLLGNNSTSGVPYFVSWGAIRLQELPNTQTQHNDLLSHLEIKNRLDKETKQIQTSFLIILGKKKTLNLCIIAVLTWLSTNLLGLNQQINYIYKY